MPKLTLHLLGPPQIDLDGEPVSLGRHKAVALLAYLALSEGSHSRDSLAALLWPELDHRRARAEVRRTLSLLNRLLGSAWFAIDRETVGWAPKGETWLDVGALRERLAACATHGHAADEVCEECVPLLAEVVALYRDGFMAGFTLPDSPAFDEWQFFETEGLRDALAGVLQRLANWHSGCNEFEAAIPYARRWVSLDPTHELAHRALMALYARSGQRAAALRQYAECERTLAEELGIVPAAETTVLSEAIRAKRALSPMPEVVVSTESPSSRPHNLPAQSTPFVGRREERAALDALLADRDVRLITVVGAGGMGKTRLVLETAREAVDRFEHGVWFVSLAPLASPEAIVPAVAQALGLSFYGGIEPRQQLLTHLRDKRMLLVLDNLEHLLAAGDLLSDLLRAAPEVRILATSRARLNLTSEHVLTLGGMAYPPLRQAQGETLWQAQGAVVYSAVELFSRSARRVRPGFVLSEETLPYVARICQLAQGMPLAILLAASWVPVLPPAEIAAEMERSLDFLAADWRDAPERHHSVRAVFDSTWAMLQEAERTAFARLSVFRGGFTREAAQAVAESDLRALVSLVNRSLLQRDANGRFAVHELLRQFATQKLDERPAERDRVLDRHCAYYAEFLQRREAELRKGHLQEAVREIDNIRAAWPWATAQRKVADIRKCLHSLSYLYQGPGGLDEGESVYAQAVEALRARRGEEPNEERETALGVALVQQGFFCAYLGDVAKGQALTRESLSILRRLDARRELALAYGDALAAGTLKDVSDARRLLEESLAISRELDDRLIMSWMLWRLGRIALRQGAVGEAETYCREAVSMSRRIDDQCDAAYALAFLGHTVYTRGAFEQAMQCYQESLALMEQVGTQLGIGRLHTHLGDVAIALHDYGQARIHHRCAMSVYEDMGVYWREEHAVLGASWGIPVSLHTLGDIALAERNGDEARRTYRQALQRAVDQPYPALHLHLLLGPAKLLAREGKTERAVELAALARYHPASIEETQGKAGLLLDALRAELTPDVFAAAEERGHARNLEETMRALLVELGG